MKRELAERGTRLHVGTRADNTPGWAEYAKKTNTTSTDKIADGREVGTLSYYDPTTNEIFISVHYPGGSVNVYTHELGHAIDFTWLKNQQKAVEWPPDSGTQYAVSRIHNDPEWKDIHEKWVLTNPNIINYYKYGPNKPPGQGQTSPDWHLAAGRSELFAEGYAMYTAGGRMRLMGFVGSAAAADAMIAVWKRYGVIE
ncbi:hypothetical protein 40AC_3 [Mycobacterium phage 40AC]|uniref:Metalloprotease n=1 Tax=Mycobacterium phage 40AC TaxID=1458717 RepID=W8ECG4_9CAUD|nr:peptidase [Mycobacterium phage 40AC]AHJ86367.1 hypothetical protein 40AC_3 [Mycobacterium phage 40AC]